MKKETKKNTDSYIQGGHNVFADLGLPTAEEDLAKAELARKINTIISKRHLTQAEAARILDVYQPRISDLVNGKISKFTLDNLVQMLNKLDWDVVITAKHKPRSREHARTLVTA